jgi:hypothetical protein
MSAARYSGSRKGAKKQEGAKMSRYPFAPLLLFAPLREPFLAPNRAEVSA